MRGVHVCMSVCLFDYVCMRGRYVCISVRLWCVCIYVCYVCMYAMSVYNVCKYFVMHVCMLGMCLSMYAGTLCYVSVLCLNARYVCVRVMCDMYARTVCKCMCVVCMLCMYARTLCMYVTYVCLCTY